MKFMRVHRRLVISSLVVAFPLFTLIVVAGVAQMRLAGTMTDTAARLLASLTPEQKTRLNYDFDTLERFNWHYIPRMRKGLALRELSANQKKLALDLLRSGLSTYGYDTVQKIMSLEPILREREKDGSMPMVRDPENYYTLVFGTPSRETPWAWRIEGHHVSVNFTIAGGRVQDDVIANTPLFFGAEPAEVQGGPTKGLRAIGAVEDKARALIDALDRQQQSLAIVSKTLPGDIFNGNNRAPDLGSMLNPMGLARQPEPLHPDGLPSAKMTAYQKQLLKTLIDEYLSRMPEEIAVQRSRALAGEFDRVHFAWIGATRAADAPRPSRGLGCGPDDARWVCVPLGFPYYYRVQGPSFLIEYMNTTGNHSHSVWRDFQNGDFGEDLLRAHYAEVHERGPVPALMAVGADPNRDARRARLYAAPGRP
jgi:hypothetical protein